MKRAYRKLINPALIGIALMAASLTAQAQADPKYKVGDHVEFTTNGTCLGSQYATPAKGTVTKVEKGNYVFGNWTGAYTIQEDPIPGKLPRMLGRPVASQDCSFRSLGGAAPQALTETIRRDENGTVLADRELVDCDHLKHEGRNGQPPPPELLKKLIRCLPGNEHPSPVGQDGATTMDITDFTIGAPHRWRTYIDMGQGTPNTIVYPVHVRWNKKRFLIDRNEQTTDAENTFTCFADADNLWQCGYAEGPHKDGKEQQIIVRPAGAQESENQPQNQTNTSAATAEATTGATGNATTGATTNAQTPNNSANQTANAAASTSATDGSQPAKKKGLLNKLNNKMQKVNQTVDKVNSSLKGQGGSQGSRSPSPGSSQP